MIMKVQLENCMATQDQEPVSEYAGVCMRNLNVFDEPQPKAYWHKAEVELKIQFCNSRILTQASTYKLLQMDECTPPEENVQSVLQNLATDYALPENIFHTPFIQMQHKFGKVAD